MGEFGVLLREPSFSTQRHCTGAFGVEGCVTCGVNDELLILHAEVQSLSVIVWVVCSEVGRESDSTDVGT